MFARECKHEPHTKHEVAFYSPTHAVEINLERESCSCITVLVRHAKEQKAVEIFHLSINPSLSSFLLSNNSSYFSAFLLSLHDRILLATAVIVSKLSAPSFHASS